MRGERGGEEVALRLRALPQDRDDALDEAVIGIQHRARSNAPPRGGRNRGGASLVCMDTADLRTLQAPLKQRYRDDPDSATITLKANGSLGDGISCSVDTGRALHEAGLHPATGGDGSQLCSGDMLLEALAACAGVTLRAVATSLGIEVRGGTLHTEGDLDFRGTLGVDKEAPVGFKDVRLSFELETDAGEEELATLLKLTERYCVVLQTLARPPRLSAGIAGNAGA